MELQNPKNTESFQASETVRRPPKDGNEKKHSPLKLLDFFRYKRIYFGLLIPISLLFTALMRSNHSLAENYTTRIYPFIASAFGRISSAAPLSLSEIFIIILIPVAVIFIARQIFLFSKKISSRKKLSLRLFSSLVCIVSIVLACFTFSCGINYHRLTFAEINDIPIAQYSVGQLEELSAELVSDANRLRTSLDEDEAGVMTSEFSSHFKLASFAREAYKNIGGDYPILSGYTVLPKPVSFSSVMSGLNISGIYNPFFTEANINVDIPAYGIPFTMMHELSHHKGFMREDEANFIAYLACMRSENIEFEYSGSMLALQSCLNALYSADHDSYYRVASQMSDAVRRDREYSYEYWLQFDTPVAKASSKVNDAYLKANNQTSGIQSYGRMVDLLLAEKTLEQTK